MYHFIEATRSNIIKARNDESTLKGFLNDGDFQTGPRIIVEPADMGAIMRDFAVLSKVKYMHHKLQSSDVAKVMKRYIEIVLAHCKAVVDHCKRDILERWDHPQLKLLARSSQDLDRWTDMYVRRLLIREWTEQFDNVWQPILQSELDEQCKQYDREKNAEDLLHMFRLLVEYSKLYPVFLSIELYKDLHLDLETIGKYITVRHGEHLCWGQDVHGTCAMVIVPPIIHENQFRRSQPIVLNDQQSMIVVPCDSVMNVDNHPHFVKKQSSSDNEFEDNKKDWKHTLTVGQLVELCRANNKSG